MDQGQKTYINYLREESALIRRERERQREMLAKNLNRLRVQLSEIAELHLLLHEQMSKSAELITIINDKRRLPPE